MKKLMTAVLFAVALTAASGAMFPQRQPAQIKIVEERIVTLHPRPDVWENFVFYFTHYYLDLIH